jgi:hypothetical protein
MNQTRNVKEKRLPIVDNVLFMQAPKDNPRNKHKGMVDLGITLEDYTGLIKRIEKTFFLVLNQKKGERAQRIQMAFWCINEKPTDKNHTNSNDIVL